MRRRRRLRTANMEQKEEENGHFLLEDDGDDDESDYDPSDAMKKKKCSLASSSANSADPSNNMAPVGVHFVVNHHPRRTSPSSLVHRWRCLVASLLALLLAAAAVLAAVALYAHLRTAAAKRARAEELAHLRKVVDAVNGAKDVRWKARFNPFGIRPSTFNHHKALKNLTAIKEYIGHLEHFFASEQMRAHLEALQAFPDAQLPREFDARQKWGAHCPSLHAVPNQGGCGSCYAVSAMGVAADRTCIHSNGTLASQLSALDVIECCEVCGNCFGGDPLKAMVYWALEGVVTGGPDGCRPYSAVSTACGTPCSPDVYAEEQAKRKCRSRDAAKCQPGYYRAAGHAEDKHKGTLAYTLFPRKMSTDQAGTRRVLVPSVIGHFNKTAAPHALSLAQIRTIVRKELFLYGPTTLALPLTEEFLHYDSGIFHPYPREHIDDRIIYWHVVRLIGWGHDAEDRLYWLAVNSFGEQWGENGLFRVDTTLLEDYGLEYETGLP